MKLSSNFLSNAEYSLQLEKDFHSLFVFNSTSSSKGFDHPVTATKYNLVTGAAEQLDSPPTEVWQLFTHP